MNKLYETKRIYVRPFEESDMTEQYRSWFHDSEVTQYNSHGLFPYTKTQMKTFLARLESSDDIVWAIILKCNKEEHQRSDEIHIGNISLQNINWINRSAELAVVIGEKEYWGKGYTTEAAQLLFSHGFNRLNLHRIFTGTSSTNFGMQKVAEKLGMIKEGIFREAMYLNGEYVDIYEYGIIRNEFNEAEGIWEI